MIIEDEYRKAQKIVYDYQEQLNIDRVIKHEEVKSKCCNAKIIPDELIGGEYCDSCKYDC